MNYGRVLPLSHVQEVTDIEDEGMIRRAMTEGKLPFLMTSHGPTFHEDDVRRFVQDRWEEAREGARQTRVALQVRERYRRWQESGAEGSLELRTCPECGTVMLVRAPDARDIDGLEFWRGDRCGECSFCDYQGYFAAHESVQSDLPF